MFKRNTDRTHADLRYEEQINSFISRAVAHADKVAPRKSGKEHEEWAAAWNKAYHGEMDRFAAEAGLRQNVYQMVPASEQDAA